MLAELSRGATNIQRTRCNSLQHFAHQNGEFLWAPFYAGWCYLLLIHYYVCWGVLFLIAFTLFIFVLEDLYQRWIFWRTGHDNWIGPFATTDIQRFSPVPMTQTNWRPVNCLLLYVKLNISFLNAKTCNLIFRDYRPWRHLAAAFTIIMSRTALKVTDNHVMFDRGAWFLSLTCFVTTAVIKVLLYIFLADFPKRCPQISTCSFL